LSCVSRRIELATDTEMTNGTPALSDVRVAALVTGEE